MNPNDPAALLDRYQVGLEQGDDQEATRLRNALLRCRFLPPSRRLHLLEAQAYRLAQ